MYDKKDYKNIRKLVGLKENFENKVLFDKISNNEKETTNVSVVGIIKCIDGILAFSDCKNTINNNGILREYKALPKINKIFKNQKILAVTCGNNTVGNCLIEDILNNVCFASNSAKYFVELFASKVQDEYDPRGYELIVYGNENNKANTILKASIFNGRIEKADYLQYFAVSGHTIYQVILDNLLNDTLSVYKNNAGKYDLTCKEMKEKIDLILNKTTTFLESVLSYVPVSKEIMFETL